MNYTEHIAIIGLSGRFPGAETIGQFWQNLLNGVESLQDFTEKELLLAGNDPDEICQSNYVPRRGIINNVKEFDANFFNMSLKQAQLLDPQQRIFLECAWECLEEAGYIPDEFEERIGVFASCSISHYLINNILLNKDFFQDVDPYQVLLGNDKDFLATQTAYKLNLRGPAFTISCGCSSSLIAVHQACQSILSGECEMAIAGGVSISLPQEQGYLYKKEMIGSPDGHCYAFDKRAEGTVKSNGAGVVLLKPLKGAIHDKDHIYATILASAINNDGRIKVGFTAPSVQQQANVITEAIINSGRDIEEIGYIETHGTGTLLGDPIEIAALKQAFNDANLNNRCLIGSLKTNIGHLDAAAGIASLIKTALCLHHKIIPPSLNYKDPNPKIDFKNSVFNVNTKVTSWDHNKNGTRLAGVSSFGVGGTNIHMILEEAPSSVIDEIETKNNYIIRLSAKTPEALIAYSRKLYDVIKYDENINLSSLSYTLHLGRKSFPYRMAFMADSHQSLLEGLLKPNKIKHVQNKVTLVFMFSGQGAQYPRMGEQLYNKYSFFREIIDYCFFYLQENCGLDLRPVLFGKDKDLLHETEYTQPAIFVIEYALAKLLISWGITPSVLIGHSIGEYTAAAVSQVMALEDALKLVRTRGKLIQQLPKGQMLSVHLSASEAKLYVNPECVIALINSPDHCVFSGKVEAIHQLQMKLQDEGINSLLLQTSHAFHSPMLTPILDEFREAVQLAKLNVPRIPIISNVTGELLCAGESINPEYWVKQLRQTVLFSAGIHNIVTIIKKPLFIEIGPNRMLETLVKKHGIESALSTMPAPYEKVNEETTLLNFIKNLWISGFNIDKNKFYHNKVQKVSLPSYAWQRQEYWIHHKKNISESKNKVQMATHAVPEPNLNTMLKEAWKKTLGIENIDEDTNFFEMGGDSLQAVNFIDALNNHLQQHLSIVKLYQYPTIKLLCEYLKQDTSVIETNWTESSAKLEIKCFDEETEL